MVPDLFLLILSVSLDTFTSAVAYGVNNIFITNPKIAVFNFICSLCLSISLFSGSILRELIPARIAGDLCFYGLIILGIIRLTDRIRVDPMKADADKNNSISWTEIIFLSVSLSIDSLFTGTLAAFYHYSIPAAAVLCFLTGELFTYFGLFLGKKLSRHTPGGFSWLGGVLLILLAILKRHPVSLTCPLPLPGK